MSRFLSFLNAKVNDGVATTAPEQYQQFLNAQNTSTKIRVLFLSSVILNECVFRDFGILPVAAVGTMASVYWSNFCLAVRSFLIASLLFMWCAKKVRISTSDDIWVSSLLALMQALFPVLVNVLLSVVIFAEMLSGSEIGPWNNFENTPTYFAQFGLQAYPLLIFFVLRDTQPVAVLISWAIALVTLFACSIYSQSLGGFVSVVLYAAISGTVFLDHHCQNQAMRAMWNRLQATQAENEKLSANTEAQELRAMIGNVAHDLKTPLTSFLSGTEYMNDIVSDWKSVLRTDKKEVFMRDAAQKLQALRNCLVNMNSTNNFMTMTINRCLDYTKTSNGFKLVPKFETVEIRSVLKLSVQLILDTHSHNNIQIRVAPIDPTICLHVITDRQRLLENLLCLLSNAAKYSNKGHVDVSVELVPNPFFIEQTSSDDANQPDVDEVAPQCLRFQALDTGVGMTDEAMQSLFSPFKQAQRLAGGTGLGLYSLAKRIDAIHGQFGVTRRPDGEQGSLFWFTIPYRPDTVSANLAECPDADKDVPAQCGPFAREESMDSTASYASEAAARTLLAQPAWGCYRVMIADDAPLVVKMVSMLLNNKGHVVAEKAVNGEDALEKLTHGYSVAEPVGQPPFDVVLMDLQMPVLDGIEAIRRLRAFEKQHRQQTQQQEALASVPAAVNKSKPNPSMGKLQPLAPIHTAPADTPSKLFHQFVVAFSANSDHETKQAAMEAGADAFLSKPFSYESFMAVVDSA